MLKIQSKYFGEIDYEPEDIITFPAGLFGFEEEHEFLLLPFEGSNGGMLCLQSITTPAVLCGAGSFRPLPQLRAVPAKGGVKPLRRGGRTGTGFLCAMRGEKSRLCQHSQFEMPVGDSPRKTGGPPDYYGDGRL